MNRILKDLVNLLNLETLEANLFRGETRDLGGKSVFGGQVIGQALAAVSQTVADGAPHSLPAYFLRPATTPRPLVHEGARIRDGQPFTVRTLPPSKATAGRRPRGGRTGQ